MSKLYSEDDRAAISMVDSSISVSTTSMVPTPTRNSRSNHHQLEENSDILSSLMSRLTPTKPISTSNNNNNLKSLNSSTLSNTSSVSTKWEEMNSLAKEIQNNVKKSKSSSSASSSTSKYCDDLSDTSSLLLPSSSSNNKRLLSSTISDNCQLNMDDSLDSTASALKRYLEKYNQKTNKQPPPMKSSFSSSQQRYTLDDSLSDLYGKLSDFSNSYNGGIPNNNTGGYGGGRDVDSSITSSVIGPLRSNNIGLVDDLLSNVDNSNLTTNTDELFTKLDLFGNKYSKSSVVGKNLTKKKSSSSDISMSSVEYCVHDEKENIEPVKRKISTTTTINNSSGRKSTTPKRPQSVKVSSITREDKKKDASTTGAGARSKISSSASTTRSKTPTSNSVSKYTKQQHQETNKKSQVTTTSSVRSPQKDLSSQQHSSKSRRANQAIENISKRISSNPTRESTATKAHNNKHFQKSQSKKQAGCNLSSSSDEDERDCKSCQTSMMIHHDLHSPSTMTTLASINSLSPNPGLSNSASNEIAFKIVGSTDNIEKVEVYLKNSAKQSFSVNSSTCNQPTTSLNDSILNETNIIESFCSSTPQPPSRQFSTNNSSPDHHYILPPNTSESTSYDSQEIPLQPPCQPPQTYYSKYFVK